MSESWGFDPKQNAAAARPYQRDFDRMLVKLITMPWYARLWWSIYGHIWAPYRSLVSRFRKAGKPWLN